MIREMMWVSCGGPRDLARGALLVACLLGGQGTPMPGGMGVPSEGVLEIRCREEGGPKHRQMGHTQVRRNQFKERGKTEKFQRGEGCTAIGKELKGCWF